MDNRPGCLSGLFKIFIIEKIFGFFQQKMGFGKGGVCGCGCGVIMFIIMIGILCSVLLGTNWTHLGF